MTKTMFITGAGSGMGQLTAQRALNDGWKVAAVDLNMAGLKVLEDNLNNPAQLLCIELNVTNTEQVIAAVDRCEKELGAIDRLVNCAGIMPLGLVTQQACELTKRITEINYFGLVNLIDTIYPRMKARRRGEIVSYSSMAGHWPMYYMAAYNASKAAVNAYTEVLHHEAKCHNVRVVCVCPPVVATPLLKQADDTIRPKIFDLLPIITPEIVVEKTEKILKGKRLWVFPGPFTLGSWLGRRWTPGLMWWLLKKLEGDNIKN